MSALPVFYEADRLEQIAINLFYGWGYNFYRAENQMRADDQLIRAHVALLLGAARENVVAAESAWRRERIKAPTRAQPVPDPTALAGAQSLERLGAAIGALVGRLTALPVPEGDRMTQRRLSEAEGLARLVAFDKSLAGQADMLRAALADRTAAWMVENAAELSAAVDTLAATLRRRQEALA